MGFSGHVESDEWSSEFVCAICSNLVDLEEALITDCSHVFCSPCLRKWLSNKSECPSCRASVSNAESVPLLRLKNPLAWRVLGRVRIRCPVGCGWTGDYFDLQSHLTSSDAHADSQDKSAVALALKNEGNEKYQAKNYLDALKLYSKAVSLAPLQPEIYSNRSATWTKLGEHEKALEDGRMCIRVDPTYSKGWGRFASAQVTLGLFEDAVQTVNESKGLCPTSVVSTVSTCSRTFTQMLDSCKKGDYSTARSLILALLEHSTSVRVLVLASRIESQAGSLERAQKFSLQAMRKDPNAPLAYVARAESILFAGDSADDAIALLKQGLHLDPDHAEALKLFKVTKLIRSRRKAAESGVSQTKDYSTAVNEYTELLNLELLPRNCPLRAQLLAERGNAHFRLGNHAAALSDCANSLYIQDDNKRAWLTKVYVLQSQRKYQQAVDELTPVMSGSWGANDAVLKGAFENAQFLLRKSNRPDYYSLFQIPSVASEIEIKSAYKLRAMEFHPDRLPQNFSKGQREESEAKFKLLGEGLEILTDSFQRGLYDQGFDKEAIQQRLERAKHGHGH